MAALASDLRRDLEREIRDVRVFVEETRAGAGETDINIDESLRYPE